MVLLNAKYEYLSGYKKEKITSKLGKIINLVQPIPFQAMMLLKARWIYWKNWQNLILASGTGEFYYTEISKLNTDFKVNKIETNLKKN